VNLLGHYPNRHTDVEVSSGNDDASKIDALVVELKAPAGDEAEGEGVSSAELIAPGLISSNTSAQADPSVVDRVISSAPFAGRQKRKCPPLIPKCKSTKSSADQVMIQIKFPPYCRPCRPFGFSCYRDYFLGVSLKYFDMHLRLLVPEHLPVMIPSLRRGHEHRHCRQFLRLGN
jgi:hypothetical protein